MTVKMNGMLWLTLIHLGTTKKRGHQIYAQMQNFKAAGKFTGNAWIERRAGENTSNAVYDKIYVCLANEHVLQSTALQIENGLKVAYMRRVD